MRSVEMMWSFVAVLDIWVEPGWWKVTTHCKTVSAKKLGQPKLAFDSIRRLARCQRRERSISRRSRVNLLVAMPLVRTTSAERRYTRHPHRRYGRDAKRCHVAFCDRTTSATASCRDANRVAGRAGTGRICARRYDARRLRRRRASQSWAVAALPWPGDCLSASAWSGDSSPSI